MAYEGEEEGEGVEYYVCFAVLGQCLDLGRFDGDAAEPDDAFEDDGGEHGADGDWRESGDGVWGGGEEGGYGFLEDLDECENHYLLGEKEGQWGGGIEGGGKGLTMEKTRMPRGSRRRRPT